MGSEMCIRDRGWSGVAKDLRIESAEGSHLELFETQYVGRLVHLTEKFLEKLDDPKAGT